MYSKKRFLYVFRRIVKARKVDIAQCNCIVTLSIVIYVDNMYSQRNRPEMLTKASSAVDRGFESRSGQTKDYKRV